MICQVDRLAEQRRAAALQLSDASSVTHEAQLHLKCATALLSNFISFTVRESVGPKSMQGWCWR